MKKFVGMICWIVVVLASRHVGAQTPKLVIWSHWGQEPVKVNFMNAAAAEFQKISGLNVEIVWIPKTELAEKLPLALDTGEPDLTYLDNGFTHQRIVRALVDLSDLKISGQVDASWRLGSIGAARNVYLPIEGLSTGIYYNKPLFEQAHITLPPDRALTQVEFLELIRKLRAAGITPIGEGSADRTEKIGLPIVNTLFRMGGPEKIGRFFKGELDFTDPDVVAALQFWKQVVDAHGYDGQKALQLNLLDGIFEVTDGKAALSFCGTYIYSKFGATARDKGQIGALDWFTAANGKGNGYYEILWGAGFGVNQHSAHRAEAQKFLEYLLTPAAAALWLQYVQAPYPVTANAIPAQSLYSVLAQQRTGQQPTPQPFNYQPFVKKAASQMWETEVRQFIAGEHTVEQVIDRMNSRLKE